MSVYLLNKAPVVSASCFLIVCSIWNSNEIKWRNVREPRYGSCTLEILKLTKAFFWAVWVNQRFGLHQLPNPARQMYPQPATRLQSVSVAQWSWSLYWFHIQPKVSFFTRPVLDVTTPKSGGHNSVTSLRESTIPKIMSWMLPSRKQAIALKMSRESFLATCIWTCRRAGAFSRNRCTDLRPRGRAKECFL